MIPDEWSSSSRQRDAGVGGPRRNVVDRRDRVVELQHPLLNQLERDDRGEGLGDAGDRDLAVPLQHPAGLGVGAEGAGPVEAVGAGAADADQHALDAVLGLPVRDHALEAVRGVGDDGGRVGPAGRERGLGIGVAGGGCAVHVGGRRALGDHPGLRFRRRGGWEATGGGGGGCRRTGTDGRDVRRSGGGDHDDAGHGDGERAPASTGTRPRALPSAAELGPGAHGDGSRARGRRATARARGGRRRPRPTRTARRGRRSTGSSSAGSRSRRAPR